MRLERKLWAKVTAMTISSARCARSEVGVSGGLGLTAKVLGVGRAAFLVVTVSNLGETVAVGVFLLFLFDVVEVTTEGESSGSAVIGLGAGVSTLGRGAEEVSVT